MQGLALVLLQWVCLQLLCVYPGRQPAPSTSSPQVTTPSGLQAVAQRSGFSKAEREEEEVRRGRSEDEQLSRVASAAIRLAGSFYKLLEEALETAISKSSTLKGQVNATVTAHHRPVMATLK